MKTPRIVLAAIGLLAIAGCSSSQSTQTASVAPTAKPAALAVKASPAKPVVVTLNAENGSKESGTATLTQMGANLQVKIALKNAPKTAQPAHIHPGTCAKLNPVPKYPLANVVGGASTTLLKNVALSAVSGGKFAVNVHKSASDLKDYVSCGNIK